MYTVNLLFPIAPGDGELYAQLATVEERTSPLCILVIDDDPLLRQAAAEGKNREALVGSRVPMARSIAGWVGRNRQPLTMHGAVHDARFAPVRPRDDISALSFPMLVGGKLVGILNVNATRRRPFT